MSKIIHDEGRTASVFPGTVREPQGVSPVQPAPQPMRTGPGGPLPGVPHDSAKDITRAGIVLSATSILIPCLDILLGLALDVSYGRSSFRAYVLIAFSAMLFGTAALLFNLWFAPRKKRAGIVTGAVGLALSVGLFSFITISFFSRYTSLKLVLNTEDFLLLVVFVLSLLASVLLRLSPRYDAKKPWPSRLCVMAALAAVYIWLFVLSLSALALF